ncbi:hypothetical protein cce_5217 [Crocosphaera subtropica ATCC 51142]|uniref:DUF4351 domain-containing protein n=1 Tax=Crocosphaera subtropica (strain ATCC 51142 / BH68) TaxID=43989 RepID=B1X352_CROS5|nr:Rpn family recombination-promoting nuclease/putative transposase [Crocosphaera subtropica]ACB54563.1 hypothetical protein cce_5217 [Crocosphaera subtropica ATCC 51142]
MYDSTCKFIAANFKRDIATWLLGKPMELTELKPSELSLEPIRADSLIFLESEDLVLHIEFQTDPDEDIPFRMLDYRLRVHRRYPDKEMHQVVIYLRPNRSSLVYQNVFELSGTRHEFRIIRMWEMPYEPLLEAPGLLPFAVLSLESDREMVLGKVARQIDEISDRTSKSNIAASTALLAGLLLDKDTINKLLREDIMKESVIYQDIKSQGKAEGKEEGRQEEAVNLIKLLLNSRFGQIAPDLTEIINQLSVEQLESLGTSLLGFQSESDLRDWLSQHN